MGTVEGCRLGGTRVDLRFVDLVFVFFFLFLAFGIRVFFRVDFELVCLF